LAATSALPAITRLFATSGFTAAGGLIPTSNLVTISILTASSAPTKQRKNQERQHYDPC
jgi:hypothetical protein